MTRRSAMSRLLTVWVLVAVWLGAVHVHPVSCDRPDHADAHGATTTPEAVAPDPDHDHGHRSVQCEADQPRLGSLRAQLAAVLPSALAELGPPSATASLPPQASPCPRTAPRPQTGPRAPPA